MSVDTLSGVVHARLDIGSARPGPALRQIAALQTLAEVADSLAREPLTTAAATHLAQGLAGGEAEVDPQFVELLRQSAAYDRPSPQHFVGQLAMAREFGYGPPSSDFIIRMADALAGAETARNTRLLTIREISYRNPLDSWITAAPQLVEHALWAAPAAAALFLFKGLLDAIRTWQERGVQLELRKLEVADRRHDFEQRLRELREGTTPRDTVRPQQVELDLRLSVELTQLVQDAAEAAAAAVPSERVTEIAEYPERAVVQLSVEDHAAARRAIQEIAPVAASEME